MSNITELNSGTVYEFLKGYVDADGNVHKEFEVKEITGYEEEAISKADIRENGGKLVRTLLERCITRIGNITPKSVGQLEWRKVIQALTVGDQDFALLQIRRETLGEEIEMKHECPHCKAKLDTVIEVDELEIIPFSGEDFVEFTLPKGYKDKNGVLHQTGKLKYPNGIDREILDPLARKNLGTANTMLLSRCIVELGTTPLTDNIIRGLSTRDREYLIRLLSDNSFGVSLYTNLTCTSCGEEFKSTLNLVNFL